MEISPRSLTIPCVSEYLPDMESGLFDQCEKDIGEIPQWVDGEDFLTEVADIERRAILETRLAISAIREFPRDLAKRAEIIIREFALIPETYCDTSSRSWQGGTS